MLHTVSRSLVKSKLFHFVYCCYSARVHFLANAMCVYIHCHRCVIERKKKQLYTAISFAQLLQCNCECIPRWLQRDQTLPLSAKGVACKTKFSSSFSKYKCLHVIASLANVKSCVTVGMFGPVQSQWITSQAYPWRYFSTTVLCRLVVTVTVASSAPRYVRGLLLCTLSINQSIFFYLCHLHTQPARKGSWDTVRDDKVHK